MLFNSYEFILIFLPITFLGYFFLNKYVNSKVGRAFLLLASVFFYSYWKVEYSLLLLFTIGFNYLVGTKLSANVTQKKLLLFAGVSVDVLLLGYFKYRNFFIENLNDITGSDFRLHEVLLPLGISFITFQTIAFLVDCYKNKTNERNLLDYALFVSFFPQLIAGPIVHHGEMLPQFKGEENKRVKYEYLLRGVLIFMLGVIKKVVIADTFAVWANKGFAVTSSLNTIEAWMTSLSYTFQLYYDFSGYCDMAVGLGLMFNIKIPFNFNSPYKATSIADFWRRWHITLSRFLRDYIYIPLGGNQVRFGRELYNLLIVFLIGGLWHGAAWTFVFWGFLHGTAIVVERLFSRMEIRLPKLLSWLLVFNFVNIAWVFFRATSWIDAKNVLKAMLGMNGTVLPERLAKLSFLKKLDTIRFGTWNELLLEKPYYSNRILLYLFAFGVTAVLFRNSQELLVKSKLKPINVVWVCVGFLFAFMFLGDNSEFLYFNF